MFKPTDLARMLSRHAKDRGNYAKMQEESDLPLHTVNADMDSAPTSDRKKPDNDSTLTDCAESEENILEASADETETTSSSRLISVSIRPPDLNQSESRGDTPTPAMMPRRKIKKKSKSFASLYDQDLPVIREYSAGGLIFNDQHHVAIIARHSRSGQLEWCLPKGHMEKGETPEQTAVREVHEETGIVGRVVDSIATIDYWFNASNHRIHKLVHHFVLKQTGGELTVEGDPDHEAEDAIWVNFKDLTAVLSNYNERRIAWLCAKKMKKSND